MSKQSDVDNRADQLNPNNDADWQSRDFEERPDDWEEPTNDAATEGQEEAKDTK